MKSIRLSMLALLVAFTQFAFAQTKTESFGVSGNCGMCKNAIEKAAKAAGATDANWNKETKQLTVTFAEATSSVAKIQQAVADAGYDNVGVKSTDGAYSSLPNCCKYDRGAKTGVASEGKASCDGKCKKDGKCDMKGKKCDGACKKSK